MASKDRLVRCQGRIRKADKAATSANHSDGCRSWVELIDAYSVFTDKHRQTWRAPTDMVV